MRTIPVPPQVIGLLKTLREAAPQDCPYVFLDEGRWNFYREQVTSGEWREGKDLMNNMLRRFQTICRRAKVREYTIHDLRRSCITNWARQLPIHVVQKLAGHSDIKTTQQFYLSVQDEDLAKAQPTQASVLGELPTPTDPKVTHLARKHVFPGQQGCQPKKEALE
jgi:integrase